MLKYPEQAKYLWKNFVPKSGQASTIQGELVRAVEKLRWEAQENGNINWDKGFEILADYINNTLCSSEVFDALTKEKIQLDIRLIKKYDYPILNDGIYDRLLDWIVEWHLENKELIPREFNPELDR